MLQWSLVLLVTLVSPDIVCAQNLTSPQIAGIIGGLAGFLLIVVSISAGCCIWCFCCQQSKTMAPMADGNRNTFQNTGYDGSMYAGGGVDPTLPPDIRHMEQTMQGHGKFSSSTPYCYRMPPMNDREVYDVSPNKVITRQYVSHLPSQTANHHVGSASGYDRGYDLPQRGYDLPQQEYTSASIGYS